MRVGVLVSCCHEVGWSVHIYWQAFLLGDWGRAQRTSTGDFEHGGYSMTNIEPLKEARCWSWNISWCLEHGLFIYGEHNPVAGSRKGIDFTFHVMRYHPRFTAIEEDGHAGGVEWFHFHRDWQLGTSPQGSSFQAIVLHLLKSLNCSRCHFRAKVSEICHMVDGFTIELNCWVGTTVYSYIFCLGYTDYEAKIFRYCNCIVSWACDQGIVDSNRAISSAKSRVI